MDNNQLIKQPFGLNIALPKNTLTEVPQAVKQEIENLTTAPLTDFFSKNYSMSPEEIENDLMKAQSRIYTLGQVMRENKPVSSFNMKF